MSKKIIIIGATSGIGRELARIYAAKGWHVGVSGRRMDLLLSLQNQFPRNIVIECFDVTGNENIIHLRSLIEKLDGVDVVIYNSGYGDESEELDWDIEKRTTDVNVSGFIEITCYAFTYLLNQGRGHIACTSSVASARGSSRAPAYNASKAFESMYMEGLWLKAKKLKKEVAVTDIQPGFVDTEMAKGDKKFWVSTVEKAAQQIYEALEKRKRIAYISRRWWLIAKLFKYMPFFVYKRFG